jgi:hypothetical protein
MWLVAIAVITCVASWPGVARAQSVIAGTARDSSAGVLPGVVVEASSDVLIERVRSTVTDGLGQYRIVDLRPGPYVVTFTLPGFQTVRREGIDLPAEFTATVDVVMQVGAIEETITVAGGVMLVDVQSAARVQRLDREAIDSIPSGRTIQSLGQLILGVDLNLPDVGGSRAAQQTYMSIRGQGARNNTVMMDGMTINTLWADGAVQTYVNEAGTAEMTYQTSGAAAERGGGGVALNLIPREGGNRFSGDATFAHRPGEWQGDNLTQRLQDSGLLTSNATQYISDLTISQGGPVLRDKLWFFGSFRDYRTNNIIPNTFFNDGSKGDDYNFIRQALVRLTYQVSPRNKLSAYYDRIEKFRAHTMQSNVDPETASGVVLSPNYSTGSVKWTSTVSSRLLAEVGYSQSTLWQSRPGQPGIARLRGTQEWFANASKTIVPAATGTRSTAPALTGLDAPTRQNIQASLSYVTGQHNIKAGFQYMWGYFFHRDDANADLTQRYRNVTYVGVGRELVFSNPFNAALGAPSGGDVLIRNTPIESRESMRMDLGLFVQDSWRYKRLTLNGGLRWERLNSQVDEFTSPAGRFVPARTQPEVADVPDWRDWAPRFQVIYDLFGDGRTAVKYSINKYNVPVTTSVAEAFNGLTATSSARTWIDLNNDDIAQGQRTWFPDGTYQDCVFLTPGCEINLTGYTSGSIPGVTGSQGALSSNFGLISGASTYTDYGRLYRWEQGVEVQHGFHPRLSATFSVFWSPLRNITKTVNLNREAYEVDYITHPMFDPITGEPFTYYFETAAYQAKATQNVTIVEPLTRYENTNIQLEARWRPTAGGQVFGGFAWNRTRTDDCQTSLTKADGSPAFVAPNTLRFCNDFELDVPYPMDFRAGLSYPLPWGITLGMSFLLNDEGSVVPTYTFTGTTRYPDGSNTYIINGLVKTTGRQAAPACPTAQGCVPGGLVAGSAYVGPTGGQTVDLAWPGRYDAERLKQIDIRLSKTFRYRSMTIAPTFEAFNITNQDLVITHSSLNYANTTGTYLSPNSLLQGRIIGWGARVAW